jgi:hypothetical protein
MAKKPKKKVGKRYNQEAIELARSLYCKYGGKNTEAIQREMRKAGYPNWTKQTLFDKGRENTPNYRMGWITKYGFEKSLKRYEETLIEKVNDDEQDLYLGIKGVRKELQKKVVAGTATKDELYQYRDFCKLEIDARRNLDFSRDNLETFVSGYEKLLNWLSELDPKAAKLLIANGDKLIELAQAHYGKTETDDDGTIDREDAGGD